VTATVADANFTTISASKLITVRAEDARVAYAGSATLTLGTSATVPLVATVKDITAVVGDAAWDPNAGDIANAQVQFVDRSTNTILGTVAVAPSADHTIGTATLNWTPSLGTATSKTFTIGLVVTNYFTRNSTADNITVTVKR
jgi:hypothetical protein